jgi:hypothetical protein
LLAILTLTGCITPDLDHSMERVMNSNLCLKLICDWDCRIRPSVCR